jgi:hypothetical protein
MKHYHQGRYTPEHPEKYAGNPKDIVYRSSWELKVMVSLDRNPSVILWNSEGLAIPYRSPLDEKIHRYFPDLLVKVKNKDGRLHTILIEIKPHAQTELRTTKRNTRKFLNEAATYVVNRAKWAAAEEFCKDQGWEFKVLTEKHLHL